MNSHMPQEEGPNNPNDTTLADESAKEQPADLKDVRVVLIGDDEIPTVALIEKRLWHVRQLYALSFILRVPVLKDIELLPMAALLLSTSPDSDLEELVPFKLQIRSAGTGTFWVDLFIQMLAHLPSGAVLKEWAVWLQNAQSAIVAAVSFCSVLITYIKKVRPHEKEPVDIKQKTNAANDTFDDMMKRLAELKDVPEDDKEQIRNAIAHNLEGILGPKWRELLQDVPPSSKTPAR
jgi:hypothetical protein